MMSKKTVSLPRRNRESRFNPSAHEDLAAGRQKQDLLSQALELGIYHGVVKQKKAKEILLPKGEIKEGRYMTYWSNEHQCLRLLVAVAEDKKVVIYKYRVQESTDGKIVVSSTKKGKETKEAPTLFDGSLEDFFVKNSKVFKDPVLSPDNEVILQAKELSIFHGLVSFSRVLELLPTPNDYLVGLNQDGQVLLWYNHNYFIEYLVLQAAPEGKVASVDPKTTRVFNSLDALLKASPILKSPIQCLDIIPKTVVHLPSRTATPETTSRSGSSEATFRRYFPAIYEYAKGQNFFHGLKDPLSVEYLLKRKGDYLVWAPSNAENPFYAMLSCRVSADFVSHYVLYELKGNVVHRGRSYGPLSEFIRRFSGLLQHPVRVLEELETVMNSLGSQLAQGTLSPKHAEDILGRLLCFDVKGEHDSAIIRPLFLMAILPRYQQAFITLMDSLSTPQFNYLKRLLNQERATIDVESSKGILIQLKEDTTPKSCSEQFLELLLTPGSSGTLIKRESMAVMSPKGTTPTVNYDSPLTSLILKAVKKSKTIDDFVKHLQSAQKDARLDETEAARLNEIIVLCKERETFKVDGKTYEIRRLLLPFEVEAFKYVRTDKLTSEGLYSGVLGKGSYGEVVLAVETDPKVKHSARLVAIKRPVARPEDCLDEIEIHKNLITLFKTNTSDGVTELRKNHILVMDAYVYNQHKDGSADVYIIAAPMLYDFKAYVFERNVTLYEQTRNKVRDYSLTFEKRTIQVGYGLFKGLDALHKKNLCHRDIKIHNVMYNSDGIFIIDLGTLFQRFAPVTMTQGYGTPAYESISWLQHCNAKREARKYNEVKTTLESYRQYQSELASTLSGGSIKQFETALLDLYAFIRSDLNTAYLSDVSGPLGSLKSMLRNLTDKGLNKYPELYALFADKANPADLSAFAFDASLVSSETSAVLASVWKALSAATRNFFDVSIYTDYLKFVAEQLLPCLHIITVTKAKEFEALCKKYPELETLRAKFKEGCEQYQLKLVSFYKEYMVKLHDKIKALAVLPSDNSINITTVEAFVKCVLEKNSPHFAPWLSKFVISKDDETLAPPPPAPVERFDLGMCDIEAAAYSLYQIRFGGILPYDDPEIMGNNFSHLKPDERILVLRQKAKEKLESLGKNAENTLIHLLLTIFAWEYTKGFLTAEMVLAHSVFQSKDVVFDPMSKDYDHYLL